jgi:excisionase family DNA binding protein
LELDLSLWAKHLAACPVEECGTLFVVFKQLAAAAAAQVFLRSKIPLDDGPPKQVTLLTLPETARILKIGVDTARAHSRSGYLPTVKIGRHVRVDPTALKAFVDGRARHKPEPKR